MTTNTPGKIITFYSYKGGTGRSMALANVAWILARNGKKVLAVDWDLEAPGLHRYFYPYLRDPDLTASEGVIDMVINFADEAVTPGDPPVDPHWYKPYANILRYAMSLDAVFFPEGGTLDFVPAGRQGPSYATRVNSFHWQNFYVRLGGGVFLDAVKDSMRTHYDYILIDSRTGVSDTAGICTVQMPDILVVCFTLNNQSIDGAAAVATAVYEQRQRWQEPITIFPVPMRVDLSEQDKLAAAREEAQKKFALFPEHIRGADKERYWGAIEVLYFPFYAYEEVPTVFGDRPRQRNALLAAMEHLTTLVTDNQVTEWGPLAEEARHDNLRRFARRPKPPVDVEALLQDNREMQELYTQIVESHRNWNQQRKQELLLSAEVLDRVQRTPVLLSVLLERPAFREFWSESLERIARQARRPQQLLAYLLLSVLGMAGGALLLAQRLNVLQDLLVRSLSAVVFSMLGAAVEVLVLSETQVGNDTHRAPVWLLQRVIAGGGVGLVGMQLLSLPFTARGSESLLMDSMLAFMLGLTSGQFLSRLSTTLDKLLRPTDTKPKK